MVAVLSGYGGVKSMRIYESRGGFRSLAEDNGWAGDLTCGRGGDYGAGLFGEVV